MSNEPEAFEDGLSWEECPDCKMFIDPNIPPGCVCKKDHAVDAGSGGDVFATTESEEHKGLHYLKAILRKDVLLSLHAAIFKAGDSSGFTDNDYATKKASDHLDHFVPGWRES